MFLLMILAKFLDKIGKYFVRYNEKYFSVSDLINSNSKLERKMSRILSNLDQEDSSAYKATNIVQVIAF